MLNLLDAYACHIKRSRCRVVLMSEYYHQPRLFEVDYYQSPENNSYVFGVLDIVMLNHHGHEIDCQAIGLINEQNEVEYLFNWLNTKIYLFQEASEGYEYVAHQTDDNRQIIINLENNPDLKDLLFELDFPSEFSPFVDQPAEEYLIKSHSQVGQVAIAEFLSEPI